MARKQKFEGGTKNKILETGSRLFFEKGFDGTGIREIMKEVGADVGAFYYYYKSKDELLSDMYHNARKIIIILPKINFNNEPIAILK